VLAPLLPAQPVRGSQWRDYRQVINAICWVKRTGLPWRDLPERYGPWKTAYQRVPSMGGRWHLALRPILKSLKRATAAEGRSCSAAVAARLTQAGIQRITGSSGGSDRTSGLWRRAR
jgi:transposase